MNYKQKKIASKGRRPLKLLSILQKREGLIYGRNLFPQVLALMRVTWRKCDTLISWKEMKAGCVLILNGGHSEMMVCLMISSQVLTVKLMPPQLIQENSCKSLLMGLDCFNTGMPKSGPVSQSLIWPIMPYHKRRGEIWETCH